MCGRYTLTHPQGLGRAWRDLDLRGLDLPSRYNIAPTNLVPVTLNDGARKVELLRWGLVPSWARSQSVGVALINARAETLAAKPAFTHLYQRRRCLLWADGFYEWQQNGRSKTPYYFRCKSHTPFAFAGLWDTWRDPQHPAGAPLRTCTLITTAPSPLVAPVHSRMPCILPPELYGAWLAPEALGAESLPALLRPFDSADLESYPVGGGVNNVRNDEPGLIAPAQNELLF